MEIVSITFFEYPKPKRWWAFNQMQLAISPLKKTPGLKFFKLLGTGGGIGFSPKPDLKTYALLMVWEDRKAARKFTDSPAYLMFNKNSITNFTYWMVCIKSFGSWGGQNPFAITVKEKVEGPIMVITRARVRFSKIIRFLKHVSSSGKSVKGANGLIYTKGIGEWPLIEQATFSYWKDLKSMENYAYQSLHREIVQKVRKEGWYKEELFARFVPVDLNNS
ncbi:MAG: spheroidene monooxygenase [Cyclobacteriaceae bacterium]